MGNYSDVHMDECENVEYYYCKRCEELVPESKLNQCPVCLKFIPQFDECVCDMLPS